MNTYIIKVIVKDSLKERYEVIKKNLEEKKARLAKEEERKRGVERVRREPIQPIKTYKNLSQRSGVDKYQFGKLPNGDDYIWIYFKSGHVYKYSTSSAGAYHMDKMLRNAARGWWLNRYVNKYKPGYYYKGTY